MERALDMRLAVQKTIERKKKREVKKYALSKGKQVTEETDMTSQQSSCVLDDSQVNDYDSLQCVTTRGTDSMVGLLALLETCNSEFKFNGTDAGKLELLQKDRKVDENTQMDAEDENNNSAEPFSTMFNGKMISEEFCCEGDVLHCLTAGVVDDEASVEYCREYQEQETDALPIGRSPARILHGNGYGSVPVTSASPTEEEENGHMQRTPTQEMQLNGVDNYSVQSWTDTSSRFYD